MDKGKLLHKTTRFHGGAKLGNRVVKDLLENDKSGTLKKRGKRDAVYNKFKDFGYKGRGLTDKEAIMALAELKYDSDDPITKKQANVLADDLGIGRGKVTMKVYRKAKKYKDRLNPFVSAEKKEQRSKVETQRQANFDRMKAERLAMRSKRRGERTRSSSMRSQSRRSARAQARTGSRDAVGSAGGSALNRLSRPRVSGSIRLRTSVNRARRSH